MPKRDYYEVQGDKLIRNRKHCPKCGVGVFLAEHKNRTSCGSCGYTEFKKQKVAPEPDEKKPPKEEKSKEKEPAEEPKEEEKPKDEPEDEKLLEGIPKDGLSADPPTEEPEKPDEEPAPEE